MNPLNESQAIEIALKHLGAEAPATQSALQNLQRQGVPHISEEGMAQVISLVWRSESLDQPMPLSGSYFWPSN
jgi:hypothetical protein